MAIGYACKLLGHPNVRIKSIRLARMNEQVLHSIIQQNLKGLEQIFQYNMEQDIRLFRISSDIIPLGSHPDFHYDWKTIFSEQLQSIGDKIKACDMRVSMHPGQYTVLNSPKKDVVQRAVDDLIYHSDFLDALGLDDRHKIILHIGGQYQNKEKSMQRFIDHFSILPLSVKNRLVLENDEKSYHIQDVCTIAKQVVVPVVFDVFHHQINPVDEKTLHEWILQCKKTWKKEDGNQKIHYSQQGEGRKGSHSAFIAIEPFLSFYDSLEDQNIDIMLEVKDKNLSCIKCINATKKNLSILALEKEWARYKYWIMSKSYSYYQSIKEQFAKQTVTPLSFYQQIEQCLMLTSDPSAHISTLEHIWGYFKKSATLKEKEKFFVLLEQYKNHRRSVESVKKHLYELAITYQQPYLLQSHYLCIPEGGY